MSTGQAAARRESVAERAGRYQVGEQLAAGGMGTIHRAYDTLARRALAYKRLKITNESARPRLTALFEREYNALRQLKHPNIVEVYDYGVDAEGPFYTMELLLGKDLAQISPLPLAEACRIVRDVASALALLHARRLVHRDVTPANIRLTNEGRAKLIDFGALSEFGVAKEIVGTPAFIAPECLSGEGLDARTDLFALGAVAYWALTRRHAYPVRSIGELMDAWDIPCTKPSLLVPDLPKDIDELVLSLLERDSVARPASAAHVIERLTTIANLAPEQDEQRVAYSYLMHPPLVGRAVVLDQLKRFLAETAEGRGRAVLIESVAGLGRSALWDQLAVSAQQSGANVVRFQPSGKRDAGLAQTITQWMRAVFPALWRAQLAKNPVLSRETRAPSPHGESANDVAQRRERLTAAIQQCVQEMSEVAPLTLLVDDVQRADAESLALLASLARAASDSRILLVLTRNEHGESSGAASALSDLSAVGTSLALRPLVEQDVELLVQTIFGSVPNAARLSRFLYLQSGGNPGQCMDLCRLLLQEQQIRYTLGTFSLPFDPRSSEGASSLQLTRLAALSPVALRFVRLLSLHDSSLSAEQSASALACDPEELLAACEELAARGLVHAHEGDVAMTSESLRQAVRGALATEDRKTFHVALSQCILAQGDGSIETKLLACRHLLSAGRDEQAIELVWQPLQRTLIPPGSIAACVPAFEALLDTMRRRGVKDEHLWSLLWPLVVAGYWGELGSLNRHRDAALGALARLSGMALARRLAGFLGKKLALMIGIAYGIFRFKTTPKRFRTQGYIDTIQRFFSAVTMSTATASSSYDPETAWQIVAHLEPMDAMPKESSGGVARQFALATAELSSGFHARSAARYGWILELLDKRKVFDPISQASFVDGCTHGRAQAAAAAGASNTLELAEALSRRHAFFRPHVETIKMTYHGLRGEKDLAAFHRKAGETLALQGGLSWSAFTVIAQRSAYIAMLSQDTLGVLQASADLERLSELAPKALVYRDLCQAYVMMARGKLNEAVQIYERIGASPSAPLMRTWELDRSFYAEALLRLGRTADAKRVCEEVLKVRGEQGAVPYALRVPTQQLALAEAKLGNFARAKQLLSDLLPVVVLSEAPMSIGSLHRDQARIALLERDASAFERHFEVMLESFRKTKNPLLIQQCRRLLAEAEKSGVVATPNWEKHELVAPANTQDLSSQAPEVTEMIETYA
jgi:tRNA A-37 threonylcarbamoyl transferase component Bud32/tetratricopeptide (TPR) repeat protein/ABC-type transporter Mla MlaB component